MKLNVEVIKAQVKKVPPVVWLLGGGLIILFLLLRRGGGSTGSAGVASSGTVSGSGGGGGGSSYDASAAADRAQQTSDINQQFTDLAAILRESNADNQAFRSELFTSMQERSAPQAGQLQPVFNFAFPNAFDPAAAATVAQPVPGVLPTATPVVGGKVALQPKVSVPTPRVPTKTTVATVAKLPATVKPLATPYKAGPMRKPSGTGVVSLRPVKRPRLKAS